MTQRQIFDQFVLAHYDTVYRCAIGLCSDRILAEDFTQQCILKLYEGFKRGHPRTGELSVGYAIRTLGSVATDHFRKESRARRARKEVAMLLAGK